MSRGERNYYLFYLPKSSVKSGYFFCNKAKASISRRRFLCGVGLPIYIMNFLPINSSTGSLPFGNSSADSKVTVIFSGFTPVNSIKSFFTKLEIVMMCEDFFRNFFY